MISKEEIRKFDKYRTPKRARFCVQAQSKERNILHMTAVKQ